MAVTITHLLRIVQLFHEAGVFLYSGDTEGLGLSADSVDEVVIGYGRCADGTLDFGGVGECDGFLGGL